MILFFSASAAFFSASSAAMRSASSFSACARASASASSGVFSVSPPSLPSIISSVFIVAAVFSPTIVFDTSGCFCLSATSSGFSFLRRGFLSALLKISSTFGFARYFCAVFCIFSSSAILCRSSNMLCISSSLSRSFAFSLSGIFTLPFA